MARQCMRPGCDRRASACLTYDVDSSAVWLLDPGDGDEPAQFVCSLHAENLTVPLGWTVTDRRLEPIPAQLPGLESVADRPVPAERASDEPPGVSGEPANPFEDPVDSVEMTSGDEPADVSEPEPPAEDSLTPPTETAMASPAEGPEKTRRRPKARKNKLLDRAFEWTGPQHSVLTTRGPSDPEADEQDEQLAE